MQNKESKLQITDRVVRESASKEMEFQQKPNDVIKLCGHLGETWSRNSMVVGIESTKARRWNQVQHAGGTARRQV